MSSGSATTTGPGRPEQATENARAITSGRRAASSTCVAHLAIGPNTWRIVELLEGLTSGRGARHLADQQDHRRRVLGGGVDPDAGVRGPRSAGDQADPGAAGELPVGLGHVRGPRLVAGDDQSQRGVVQRVEHGEVALARDAEGQLGAMDGELIDEDLASGAGHVRTSGASQKIVAFWVLGLSASAGST